MILYLDNGDQLRGDVLCSAVLRSDLAPIPCTLEAEVRLTDEIEAARLVEGKTLKTAADDSFTIVKAQRITGRSTQGDRVQEGVRITALLTACLPIAYVRDRAIIKEGAGLAAIYRSAGATIKGIDGDFPVPRFYCPIGETPSYHIARILQEEGGAVRWKNGRLKFFTLSDMMRQKVSRTFRETGVERVETGFLERHSVPWFYSLNESGGFVYGNRTKARRARYSPFKNALRLRNMTHCLVRKMIAKVPYDQRICAGDVVQTSSGEQYAVITAAHVFDSGAMSGEGQDAYTKLWLGVVED